jgi:hypothetical protein
VPGIAHAHDQVLHQDVDIDVCALLALTGPCACPLSSPCRRSPGDVSALLSRVQYSGLTPLATSLRDKVLSPIVYSLAAAGQLAKPVLVITITDGEPTDTPKDLVAQVVLALRCLDRSSRGTDRWGIARHQSLGCCERREGSVASPGRRFPSWFSDSDANLRSDDDECSAQPRERAASDSVGVAPVRTTMDLYTCRCSLVSCNTPQVISDARNRLAPRYGPKAVAFEFAQGGPQGEGWSVSYSI